MNEQTARTRLQHERLKRQWTQKEVAQQVGIDVKTLSRWERGDQTAAPQKRRMLSKLFKDKVDVSWFQPVLDEAFPGPIFKVPYERNPYYIDSRNSVESLYHLLHTDNRGIWCQSISGLGGIGKTQLVLEYSYRYQDEYSAVLWVNATTQAQLRNDLASLGNILHAPEAKKREPRQHFLINEVILWLQTFSSWLLIIDNVEEDLDTHDPNDIQIAQFLALPNIGHILLTTRSQSIARQSQNILLETMEPEEGAQLLLQSSTSASKPMLIKTSRGDRREDAIRLSTLLGGLPLALEQARAYIEATQCGFTGYIQLYEECRKQLLQELIDHSRLEKEYKESVATTWLLSFRHVEQQSPLATDLLKLFSFLAPDTILEDIVLKGAERIDGDIHTLAGNPLLFNHVCQVLLNYSLIKRYAGEGVLSIHRLVQAVVYDRLDQVEQSFWGKQAVRAVDRSMTVSQSSVNKSIERYVPHALVCALFIKQLNLQGPEIPHLLHMTADILHKQGRYTKALPLTLQAFNTATDQYGVDSPEVLSRMIDLARAHMDVGATPLALLMLNHVKKELEQQGADIPEILTCLHLQTRAYILLGNLQSAEETSQATFAWCREHAVEMSSRITAYLLGAQAAERLQATFRAEAYYKAALELQLQVTGNDHADTAKILVQFGAFYLLYQQEHEQAESLLQRAVDILQKTGGNDHPDLANCFVYLGIIYWDHKDYKKAEQYYQQALIIFRQKLGFSHPDVVHTLHDLAQLIEDQQESERAERYFLELLALAPLAGGTETPEYAEYLRIYARFLTNQQRNEEAQALLKERERIMQRLKSSGPLYHLQLDGQTNDESKLPFADMWFFKRN